MFDAVEKSFRDLIPSDVDFFSLRLVREHNEHITVRDEVLQPVVEQVDTGAMVTVVKKGGLGYAGTSDLSPAGLARAVQRASQWAERTANRSVCNYSDVKLPHPTGTYQSQVDQGWGSLGLGDKIEMLQGLCKKLGGHDKIIDRAAGLWHIQSDTLYLTNDNGRVEQHVKIIAPEMSVTANEGTNTQTRSMGFRGESQQGGLEVLNRVGFAERADKLRGEVLELLSAPNCPEGKMDLVLMPDQMMLQIHESIGHPLELDRILGDERNYAGTSFVTMDMFGEYRYGSDLLNITFDPTRTEQMASYAFDDDGAPAERTFIIENGILQRPLGSVVSQQRAGMNGVACARATSWNRPPIDRMANLNLEPGDSTFEDIIANTERGVLMRTNRSWSIDDSRNKFQFGCEWGQLIEDGKLTQAVRNPNYRGISATFWRNLAQVGNESTLEVLGTPYCGKGEPNQVIRVGHASPVCRFSQVDVFGGE